MVLTEYTKDQLFVVSVDSRGENPADLHCYKEHTVDPDYFYEHIRDYPKNLCVQSPVAALCGLELKLYYHDHSQDHAPRYLENLGGLTTSGQVNGIATLLTFDPDTGEPSHRIEGKAYVVCENGHIPLSKRQVWGIQELLHEALKLYHNRDSLFEARQELFTWCFQYHQGTWVPRSIYEPRHIVVPEHPRPHLFRRHDSDQATCHHGEKHQHHLINKFSQCCQPRTDPPSLHHAHRINE